MEGTIGLDLAGEPCAPLTIVHPTADRRETHEIPGLDMAREYHMSLYGNSAPPPIAMEGTTGYNLPAETRTPLVMVRPAAYRRGMDETLGRDVIGEYRASFFGNSGPSPNPMDRTTGHDSARQRCPSVSAIGPAPDTFETDRITGHDSAEVDCSPLFGSPAPSLPQETDFQYDSALFLPESTATAESNPAPASAHTFLLNEILNATCARYEKVPTAELGDIRACYERCLGLSDLLRAAHTLLNEYETSFSKAIKDIWEQNPDLRQTGLTGGHARKQRKVKTYVPIARVPADQKERRKNVEEQDAGARQRLEGVRALKLTFEEGFHHLRAMLGHCDVLIRSADAIAAGAASEEEARGA